MKSKTILFELFVSLVITCVPQIGEAAPLPFRGLASSEPAKLVQPAKSFAVFTASFNSQGNDVRGGVNGTVFFVTPTMAITAYHVLQARTFQPLAGFAHVRVWLVHENEPALEIESKNLEVHPDQDMTIIHLPSAKAVATRFVFATSASLKSNQKVEAEGFRANTVGPTLVRNGTQIDIVAVRQLERMHLEGQVVRAANVAIKAIDLDLKGTPCVELSYQPIVGFSGGPVVAEGKVVAMNSFADPATRKQTWAQVLNLQVTGAAARP